MRITAQAKKETEHSIRSAARKLFGENGLARTSTRDLAAESGTAVGTLFNYFPSKEALALALVADALDEGREASRQTLGARARPVEEELFILLASALSALAPMHRYLGEVLEAGLSPLSFGSLAPEAQRIREGHLSDVLAVLERHGLAAAASAPVMHLYWALFLSVLAYWAADTSPTQEETRALIDQTVRMFVAPLRVEPLREVPAVPLANSFPAPVTTEDLK